jgi:nucleoside-diphosphate-sugar epimerase
MKVLLIGAFGNIGTETLRHLLRLGHEVRCFDLSTWRNRRTARGFGDKIDILWGDVRHPADLATAVQDQEVVVHLAFNTDILRSEMDPQWAREINVEGTANILEAMASHPEPRSIVFTSSTSVYGDTQHLPPPCTIFDLINPRLVYARHKVECEGLIKASDLDWCILRMVFSPSISPTRFEPALFHAELDSRMEFIHPTDAGLAIANAVNTIEVWGRTLLVGGGRRCQMTYGSFVRQLMADIGGMPSTAFAPPGSSSYMDWVDSAESQRILTYQQRSMADLVSDRRAAFGRTGRLVPALAPLLRHWLLRQSPYYRARRKR